MSCNDRRHTDKSLKMSRKKRRICEKMSLYKIHVYKCASMCDDQRENVFKKVYDLTWPPKQIFVPSHVAGNVKQRKVSTETFRKEKYLKYFENQLWTSPGLSQNVSGFIWTERMVDSETGRERR